MAKKDPEITQYTLKNGKSYYRLKTYLGIDPETGEAVKVSRSKIETRKEAIQLRTQLKAKGPAVVARELGLKKQKITVDDVWKEWLPIYSLSVKPVSVHKRKVIYKNDIFDEFGNSDINNINIKHLQNWVNTLAQKYLSYQTKIEMLKTLIKFAIVKGYADKNPFDRIIIPKKSAKAKKDHSNNFFELNELKQFLEAAKDNSRNYTYFSILAATGMRRSEAAALNWDDIDFENKIISVNRTITTDENGKKTVGSPKTPNSKRILPISNNLYKILLDYKKERQDAGDVSPLLFHTKNGDYHDNSCEKDWINSIYRKHPELKRITMHGFRHTFATLLYEGDEVDVKPKDVQMALGHEKPNLALDIYTHQTEKGKEYVRKSINNLDI